MLEDHDNGWIPNGSEMNLSGERQRLYYLYDELGSVTKIIGENGKTSAHYNYDEFGRPLPSVKFDQNWPGPDNTFGYTGYQYDVSAELWYAQARYYMPEIGRFISEDPWSGTITTPTTMNPYPYVLNNPLKYVDPLGLSPQPSWAGCPGTFIQDLIDYGKELEASRPYVYDPENWQNELNSNITPLIKLVPNNITDEQRRIIIDAIIITEVQKLQAKYEGAYNSSNNFVSKYITDRNFHKNLAPLFEQYPRDKNINGIVKAGVDGLLVGLLAGTWYSATSPANNAGTKSNFGSTDKLEGHFAKHGGEFKGVYKNADEYLQGARNVMNNGYKVQYNYKGEIRTGYVKFMETSKKGIAKFEFVGTNNLGEITTYHVESGKDFWKMLNGQNIPVINSID